MRLLYVELRFIYYYVARKTQRLDAAVLHKESTDNLQLDVYLQEFVWMGVSSGPVYMEGVSEYLT